MKICGISEKKILGWKDALGLGVEQMPGFLGSQLFSLFDGGPVALGHHLFANHDPGVEPMTGAIFGGLVVETDVFMFPLCPDEHPAFEVYLFLFDAFDVQMS